MNWAVIGLGGAGTGHANTINSMADMTLACGHDPFPEARQRFADAFGVHVHPTLDTLLGDTNVDGVTIAAASHVHTELTLKALAAGKHVMVEKPFADNAAAATKMADAAQAAGKVVAPYQNRRFDPDFEMVKEVISSGRLGTVRRIHSTFATEHPMQGWRSQKDMGGGHLLDWGPHLLDQVLSLSSSAVTDVFGTLLYPPNPETNGDADNYFRADLRFADGLNATIEMAGYAFIRPPRWVVYGDHGTLQLLGNMHQEFEMIVRVKGGEEERTATSGAAERERRGAGGERAYQQMLDAISGQAKLLITPRQAGAYMAVIDAVFASAASGQSIRL